MEVWEAKNDGDLLRSKEGVGRGGGGRGRGRAAEGVDKGVKEEGEGSNVLFFSAEDFKFSLELFFSFSCEIFTNLGVSS